MNLFKTTALALVLGAFGLAHSAADEAKEQAQSSSRVAKTIPQLKEEIGTIVNTPGASKRKMEAIRDLLAGESEEYTFTSISSIPNAGNLIGTKNIEEILKELNLVAKNPAPAAEEEEEEKKSQGSASGEEEEDEGEEEEGSKGSASGEEEEDEGEEEVDEEEGVPLSAKARAFLASLEVSAVNPSLSEIIETVITKISANTEALTAEKEEALKSAAQAKDEAAQAQIKLEQAKADRSLFEKTAAHSAGAMEARLEAVRTELGTEKQKLQQAEAALSKAQRAEEIARNALRDVQTASKEKETTLTAEKDAVRATLEETEDALARERALLQEATAKAEEFKEAQDSLLELTEKIAASKKLLAAQAQTHAEELVQKEAAVRAEFANSVPLTKFEALETSLAEMDEEIRAKSQVNLDQAKLLRKLQSILNSGNLPKKDVIHKLLLEIQAVLAAE